MAGDGAGNRPQNGTAYEPRVGSRPEDILAGIGPSIGPCCFEVGPEVKAQFVNAFPAWQAEIIRPAQDPEKSYIDLWRTNELILRRAGIREEHITVTDLCTKCHSEYFHSHRRMGMTVVRRRRFWN